MSQPHPSPPSRRELLARGLRFAAIAALACSAGAAILKRRRLLREGKCISSGICRGCRILKTCPLPQALSIKKALKDLGHA